MKTPVACPKRRVLAQPGRRQQVDINVSDAEPGQSMKLNEFQDFPIGRDAGLRQIRQSGKNSVARI